MKNYIEERAIEIANYIIQYNATVRQAAKKYGISKSTVHKDDGVIIGTVKGSAKKPLFWRVQRNVWVETDLTLLWDRRYIQFNKLYRAFIAP